MPMSSVRMINDMAPDEPLGLDMEGDAGDCCADTPTGELASNIQLAIAIGRAASIGGGPRLRTVCVLFQSQTCPCKVKQQDPR